jgi:hypothetical protein
MFSLLTRWVSGGALKQIEMIAAYNQGRMAGCVPFHLLTAAVTCGNAGATRSLAATVRSMGDMGMATRNQVASEDNWRALFATAAEPRGQDTRVARITIGIFLGYAARPWGMVADRCACLHHMAAIAQEVPQPMVWQALHEYHHTGRDLINAAAHEPTLLDPLMSIARRAGLYNDHSVAHVPTWTAFAHHTMMDGHDDTSHRTRMVIDVNPEVLSHDADREALIASCWSAPSGPYCDEAHWVRVHFLRAALQSSPLASPFRTAGLPPGEDGVLLAAHAMGLRHGAVRPWITSVVPFRALERLMDHPHDCIRERHRRVGANRLSILPDATASAQDCERVVTLAQTVLPTTSLHVDLWNLSPTQRRRLEQPAWNNQVVCHAWGMGADDQGDKPIKPMTWGQMTHRCRRDTTWRRRVEERYGHGIWAYLMPSAMTEVVLGSAEARAMMSFLLRQTAKPEV